MIYNQQKASLSCGWETEKVKYGEFAKIWKVFIFTISKLPKHLQALKYLSGLVLMQAGHTNIQDLNAH